MITKPEIMSPAGQWPQLRAAIEAGADSVYFGLTHFTARAKVGFTLEELPTAIATLHQRGVKGYVTFNTLVFDRELESATKTIEAIAASGADAIIIQDLGIATLVREIAPDLEIHASTQMSITNSDGVRLAQRLGATRVNLARELSLEEIARIRRETDAELEIFVHGALCVAYSGQCFSSEAWGGRSANRGQCAQACRLPYQLVVDDHIQPLGDARYLLSPGDLYTLEWIPRLIPLGISSLKIEGRYKDAEYVAITTAAYRKAVDAAAAITPAERLQLEQVYSRGLGPYFLSGTDHQKVVEGRSPRHRGVLMGQVVRVTPEAIEVSTNSNHRLSPLKPGDGVVFDAADWRSPQEKEEGGRLYSVTPAKGNHVLLGFANRALDISRIRQGDLLWRSSDHELDKLARRYTDASQPVYQRPIHATVTAITGQPLAITLRYKQHAATATSPQPLDAAQRQGLTETTLRDALSRLGNTPFTLGQLEANITGNPFVPASLLNQLRREAVDQLSSQLAQPVTRKLNPWRPTHRFSAPATPIAPQIHLLVRNAAQLDAAIAARPASITLDYLDLYGLWPSLEKLKASGITPRVASPRVLKPGEDKIADFLVRVDTSLLVRAAGLLDRLKGHPHLTGDFSLNAANAVTARLLLDMGLERLTPTHDCNAKQIVEIARATDPARIELVAYQHLPVFHTEHCVFCRFLSTGTSYLDCGRPCEKHQVSLEDEQCRRHPLVADVGCRNTVFGAEAQHAAPHLDSWLAAGIRHFRLEFVHESADQVESIARAFSLALAQKKSPAELERELSLLAPEGLTQGSLLVPKSDPVFRIL